MTNTTAPAELMLNPENPREREVMLVEREFSMQQRKAKVLASSTIVPKDYQNNIANCMIAMEMSHRLGAGELEVMQNLHIIHGRPSFSASYLIAQVNTSGILKGRLKFRMTGTVGKDDRGCIAYGECAETGDLLEGTEITIALAKKEGWYSKNGSKWQTMPEQMLMYRAASFWSRIYAPDATMGMHTSDEIAELPEREINPQFSGSDTKTSDLNEALRGKKKPQATEAPDVIDAEPATEESPEPEPETEQPADDGNMFTQ